MYNKQWKQIAELVKTRTVVQIRTHAQKYFQKLDKMKDGKMPKPATSLLLLESKVKSRYFIWVIWDVVFNFWNFIRMINAKLLVEAVPLPVKEVLTLTPTLISRNFDGIRSLVMRTLHVKDPVRKAYQVPQSNLEPTNVQILVATLCQFLQKPILICSHYHLMRVRL